MKAQNSKIFRALPPSGGFLSPFSIIKSLLSNSGKDGFEVEFLPDHSLYFLNSGKSALYAFFLGLKDLDSRREIAVSAYTCPDIVLVAIKAGFKIRLIDLDLNSTTISVTQEKVSGCVAVILSNLYGLPDDVSHLDNVFIVDDACQGALSFRGNEGVGFSTDKIGIISLGRGKAFCGSGGGVLVVPKRFEELNSKVFEVYRKIEKQSFLITSLQLIKSILFWLLESPILYRCVLFLPFLKIGETVVNPKFKFKRGSGLEVAIFRLNFKQRAKKIEYLNHQTKKYLDLFSTFIKDESLLVSDKILKNSILLGLIRFPLLISQGKKQDLVENFKTVLKLNGITISYPKIVKWYFASENFTNFDVPMVNAEKIVEKIVTLPLGPYVRESDQIFIKNLITKNGD